MCGVAVAVALIIVISNDNDNYMVVVYRFILSVTAAWSPTFTGS